MPFWGTSQDFFIFIDMYIRRKRNKSGSISIQLVTKRHGKISILETIGVANNAFQEQQLRKIGKARIDELRAQLSLPFETQENRIIRSFLSEGPPPVVTNIGPELILGSSFDTIGLNAIREEMFRHITLARLVYPVSKLKTSDYLLQHHGINIDINSIYRFLDRFYHDYKEIVKQIVYEHSRKILGKISIVFYDMTTLFFESEDEDDLRKIGFSKDGKFQNPQIMLGLLVGENGYPIGYDVFEGNSYEGHTLIPTIQRVQEKYNLPKPVVVADSGLLSKANIGLLIDMGYQFILGARIKNETYAMQQRILSSAQTLSDGEAVRIEYDTERSLIISYTQKRADKDFYNREKGLTRLRQSLKSGKLTKEHVNKRGYNKFLKITGNVMICLDEEKIAQDTKWDGLKGYVTNSNLSVNKIIKQYRELWKIEKAFRISKTDLRIRPIYHRKKERIEAHLCIAFAAYAIYKELERKLQIKNIKISPAKAIELSKTIFQISFQLPDTEKKITVYNQISEEQKILIDALGVPR